MSDAESRREDALRDAYYEKYGESDCLSGDPYCSRNVRHIRNTYEEYIGALCSECEDDEYAKQAEERLRSLA